MEEGGVIVGGDNSGFAEEIDASAALESKLSPIQYSEGAS